MNKDVFKYFVVNSQHSLITWGFDIGIPKLENELSYSASTIAEAFKCNASVKLKSMETEVSNKGNELHDLAALMIVDLINKKKVNKDSEVYEYVQYCFDLIKDSKFIGIESKCVVKDNMTSNKRLSGYIDFWAYNERENELTIVDLKTGNYPVRVEDNKQLLTYARILEDMLYVFTDIAPIKKIKLVIHQKGFLKEWEVPEEKYNQFKNDLIIFLSKDKLDYNPGSHCGSCFKRMNCPVYTDKVKTELTVVEKKKEDLLTMDQDKLAELYEKATSIEKMIKLVKDVVKSRTNKGEMDDTIQKVKVRSTIVWKDKKKAIEDFGENILIKDIINAKKAKDIIGEENANEYIEEKIAYSYKVIGNTEDIKRLGRK